VTDALSVSAVRAYRLEIPLETAYELAYTRFEAVENAVVRVDTESGLTGWGCAAPDGHVTGESVAGNLEVLREALVPELRRAGESTVGKMLRRIEEAAPDDPAARAALDLALHDLWAKQRRIPVQALLGGSESGIPVQTLLGGSESGIPTSITVGIMNVEKTCSVAGRCVAEGFRILKLKGGRDPGEDIERVRAVRRLHGTELGIRLDANQGYSVDQARSVMRALAGEIEFLEQPVAAGDLDGLAALAAEAVVPVMADEPVLGPDEAREVMSRGLRLVCVKLMKSGGLSAAVRVCDIAREHGARVMIGCMDELPISMAGAAHLALSHPAVVYADLDGHIGMVQRVATGGLEIRNGRVFVTAAPGLGVRVDEDRLEEFRVF
jgi:L-alanine-DL-glutamate epimerase-like enolase superfamily enzyme